MALALTLVMVSVEVSMWPINDYGGAMFHNENRGDDIELPQARAAVATWKDLAGYWTGPSIHGNGYYRPLASWLFVAEYRLFGTNDRQWCWISILLYELVALALLLATLVLVPGSFARRLGTACLAVGILAAPTPVVRLVERWMITWWPCQPDMLALLFGLTLFAAVIQYVRTNQRRYFILALAAFLLAALTKEMGYVAGLGACMLLVRQQKHHRLLFALAALGVVAFAYRYGVLHGQMAEVPGPSAGRLLRMQWIWPDGVVADPGSTVYSLTPILVALAAGKTTARRIGVARGWGLALVIYLVLGTALLGTPTDPLFQASLFVTVGLVLRTIVLTGFVRALRHWPVPELAIIWLVSMLVISGYSFSFGHYRYWSMVLGSLLAAVSWVYGWEWWWPRLCQFMTTWGYKPLNAEPLSSVRE